MPAALAVGGAVGPVLAGALLANAHGYTPLYALFAGATAAGLLDRLLFGRSQRRAARATLRRLRELAGPG
jgi:hypothetical protein